MLRIGVLALCLMVSLPFLLPVHTVPIPSFRAEWLAAALGLAGSAALVGARGLPLPGAALLALALAAVVLAQAAAGRIAVPQLGTLFVLYLAWAALLASTGRHLASGYGGKRLVRMLAGAILTGSLVAAAGTLLRPWLPLGDAWFQPNVGGPLGQANHLTAYLWLGLASALYLRSGAALSASGLGATVLVLTLTVTLAGQRSSFLYLAMLLAVGAWQARTAGRAALRPALGVALAFALMHAPALLLGGFYQSEAAPPPALRALQQAGGPSVRMQLAQVGLSGIAAAPLLGNGVGSYPSLSLRHADEISPEDNPGPSEHAHNLFVHLGAELGIPAMLSIIAAAVLWLRRLPRRGASAEAAWAAAILGVMGLHSMIEYPLWYTYFLGPFALVAGMFGARNRVGSRLTPAATTVVALVSGALLLGGLKRDYALIELALALGWQPANKDVASAALLRVPQRSLLTPWVDTTACASLDPLRVTIADGLAVCRVGTAFVPGIDTTVNRAVLSWRAGEPEEARELIHRLRLVAQHDAAGLETRLTRLAAREPRLRTLMEETPKEERPLEGYESASGVHRGG